ncbi:hypothetical protein GGR50DRAFT_699006 [Xylaria sp. CBS 124048]|nr:hypothetical protein GGR50DRAFT_699006 [Xylaria sp. CBS 124048]
MSTHLLYGFFPEIVVFHFPRREWFYITKVFQPPHCPDFIVVSVPAIPAGQIDTIANIAVAAITSPSYCGASFVMLSLSSSRFPRRCTALGVAPPLLLRLFRRHRYTAPSLLSHCATDTFTIKKSLPAVASRRAFFCRNFPTHIFSSQLPILCILVALSYRAFLKPSFSRSKP